MNLPNALTLIRIFLIPFVVVVLLTKEINNWAFWGVFLFLGAALTDILDGFFNCRSGQLSGKKLILQRSNAPLLRLIQATNRFHSFCQQS